MPDTLKALFLLFATALLSPALASTPITVSHAWIRWVPGNGPVAGYMKIHNGNATPVTLTAVSGPAFRQAELHRSMTKNGMDTMKQVHRIRIPAHSTFAFSPGNYHLMLWRKQPLKVGSHVPITLTFSTGKQKKAVFTVKGLGQ